MTRKPRWSEQSPAKRTAITVLAVLDAALRAWSLADLAKRPQEQVKGPKAVWAAAISVVNSAGLLPTAYLIWARREH